MHDAFPVPGRQRGQHTEPDPGHRGHRQWTVGVQCLLQGPAGDEFHDEPRIAVVRAYHVKDLDCVGVLHPGQRASLPHRPGPHGPLFVVGESGRGDQFLERHVPPEHLVPGVPDPAHAALADRSEDAVPAGNHRLLIRRHPRTVTPTDAGLHGVAGHRDNRHGATPKWD